MRFYWIPSAVLILLIVNGCADFVDKQSLTVKIPEVFSEQISYQSNSDSSNKTSAKLNDEWWKRTDDKILINAINSLEKLNLSLEQAKFRLNAARIQNGGYDYLPSIVLNNSSQFDRLIEGTSTISNVATGSGGKQNTGYYSANIDASWEIPIYRQLGYTNKVANAQIVFAESDVKAVRASVISEAVRLYTQMRSKQNEVEKRKIILSSYEKIADYQKIKHNAGLITDSEMSMSNRSLLMAQNELKITENESVISMRQLAKLFGLSEPDKIWKNIATIPTFDVPSFSDTPLDVLRNRPDIRKAEASVLVAAGKLKLSKSQMYPKLNITGSLSQLGNIMGDPLSGNIVQLSSVPSISIPLLDWSKRFTATKVNEETLREKASIYRETVISAMNEVEESWSAYKTALTTEKSASKIKNISDKASKHKILLFKEGISDGIEAENAIIDAASASIIQLQAKADTITKLTLLTKALGGVAAKTITEKKND